MKVAHLDAEPKLTGTVRELLDDGKRYESEQGFEKAVKVYQTVIRKDQKNETAYNRLMIVLRKLKNYSEESKLIDQAIEAFEMDERGDKKKGTANIEKLSLSLGKLTGLIDKKGKSLYDPEPVATWKKRKLMVQKRLKSKTKTKKSNKSSSGKKPALKGMASKDADSQQTELKNKNKSSKSTKIVKTKKK